MALGGRATAPRRRRLRASDRGASRGRDLLIAHPAAVAGRADGPARGGPARRRRGRSGRSARPTAWSRSSGWPRSGSGSTRPRSRQTQQGTLYKRDRERLEDDPVLAGPIADALEPLPDMAASLARPGARGRPGRPGAGQRPGRRRPARVLVRERRPPAADDRDPLARAPRPGTSRGGCSRRGARSSWRCPTSGPPSCSGSPRSTTTTGWRSTTSTATSAASRPAGTARRSSPSVLRRAPSRGRVARGRANGRRTSRASPTRGPGGAPARAGLPARAGPGGRGGAERPAGRPAHAPGPLRPGARAAAAAPAELRALPVRPAELRDHRLSPGADARP